MAQMNKCYEPTEYEAMLIAAGWISMGEIDPDYLAYLRSDIGRYETMSYQQWLNARQVWDQLNAEFEKHDPLANWNEWGANDAKKECQRLLKEMGWLESCLGL